jgi:5-methylcytosine-specific restriction endonuclease McrA
MSLEEEPLFSDDIYVRANEEFRCDHPHVELRRRTFQVSGKPVAHIWRQCTRCGKGFRATKKPHPLSSVRVADLEPYDEELEGIWQAAWRTRLDELRRQRNAQETEAWRSRYEAYLQTPAWQEIRERVLARDGHVCQGCLGQSGLPATQVHHLTYDHLREEFGWELVAICRACHERLHGRSEPTDAQAEQAVDGAEDLDTLPF